MNMTIDDACARFLTHCETEKNLSALTIRAYRGDLQCFANVIGPARPLVEFSETWIETTVQRWSADPTIKATTVKRRAACVKVFVRWLFRRRLISFNPLERIQLEIKIPKRLPRNLQTEEISKLVAIKPEGMSSDPNATDQPMLPRPEWDRLTARLAIEVLFLTGVRVGELVKIRLRDIDHNLRQVRVLGKGNRERHVSFPDAVTTERLNAYRALGQVRFGATGQDALFFNSLGRPANEQYIRRIIRAFAESADLTRRVSIAIEN
jgi:integrase/recombinase XerD